MAAPAGSGKTVVVRSWLDARGSGHHAAWVSVERRERDAQRFWSAVVNALCAAAPDGAIEPLAPSPVFDGGVVVKRLARELGSLKQQLILVIDDLHEIAGGDIRGDLTYLLDQLPNAIHVVLIGRRDPQLGLHRRQLEGGLTEIRSAHLNFTLAETREMMSALKITLSDEGLGLLHNRTEGWVVSCASPRSRSRCTRIRNGSYQSSQAASAASPSICWQRCSTANLRMCGGCS